MQAKMSIDWRIICASKSVYDYSGGRESGFNPLDIMSHIANQLTTKIERFNASQFGDDEVDDADTVPIVALDDILDEDSDIDD